MTMGGDAAELRSLARQMLGLSIWPTFGRSLARQQWLLNKPGPVPESPSCDGEEGSVIRCFQHQIMIPQKTQQAGIAATHASRMLWATATA